MPRRTIFCRSAAKLPDACMLGLDTFRSVPLLSEMTSNTSFARKTYTISILRHRERITRREATTLNP